MSCRGPRIAGTLSALIVSFVLASPLATPAGAQEQVQLFLSLVDAAGAPVTDLTPEDVSIVEDGEERRTLRLEPIDWPMKLTILIDNGPAATESLVQLRNGLRGLLEALPPDVQVGLVTVNPQPRFVVRFTDNRQQLVDGLGLIVPDASAAKMVEGLLESAERAEEDDSDHFPVIFGIATDGTESSAFNENDLKKLQERIALNRVTVHFVVLTLGAANAGGVTGQVTMQLAQAVTELTTGRYETISSANALATILPEYGELIGQVQRRQSAQYRITYERPRGAAAPTQGISLNTSREGVRGVMSFDGRIPQP